MSGKIMGSIGLEIDESVPPGIFLTAPTVSAAANSIKSELMKAGGRERMNAVLITTDALRSSPKMEGWCRGAKKATSLIVLGDLGDEPLANAFTTLPLPSTLHDVSVALGVPAPQRASSIHISAQGKVEMLPDIDDDADDEDWADFGDETNPDTGDEWFDDAPQTTGGHYTTGPQPVPVLDSPELVHSEHSSLSAPMSADSPEPTPETREIEPPKPEPVTLQKIPAHDELMISPSSLRRATSHRLGAVVAVMGASGGVGKTTMSVYLAQRATDRSRELSQPLSVCLVDANPGQPDTVQRLFIHNGGFVSLGQVAIMRDYASAINSAESLSEMRASSNLHPVDFDYVTSDGDTRMSADETVSTYSRLIDELREKYDLVVIDVKTAEGGESNHIVEGVVKPLLSTRGSFAVFMTRDSNSTNNLTTQSAKFLDIGVPRESILSVLNDMRVSGGDSEKIRKRIPGVLNATSTFVGETAGNAQVSDNGPRGIVNQLPDDWKAVTDKILYHVIGLDIPEDESDGRGLWSRLFGRKKAAK